MRLWPLFLLFFLTLPANRPCFAQGMESGHPVEGVVREEGSNAPVSAAKVDISMDGVQARPTAISSFEGQFSFAGLKDGEYSVVVSKDGYDAATVSVTMTLGGATPVTVMLHRKNTKKVTSAGDSVSVHELKVPDKARASYDKGKELLDKGKAADSIPEFQQAVTEFPSYYEAYMEMGVANYSLNKYPEAEQAFRKAVELSEGKSIKPLCLLADLDNNQRRYQEAETLARQAIALDEASWNAHFELARALVGFQKGVEAETSALRAKELAPEQASIYLVLASAHQLQHNLSATVQDFDAYLKLEPSGSLSDAVRQRRDRLQKSIGTAPSGQPSAAPSTPQR
jgi:tetratricopeptide (TPR) repeat protein